ncbi:unnamed protein product [Peniophora sp. CBMAI 1063]|nr:unnamed protein product [Peniophora sp. CBMAI 1063]
MAAVMTPLNTVPRPHISSPLASPTSPLSSVSSSSSGSSVLSSSPTHGAGAFRSMPVRPQPQRKQSFPVSRPLRPFASISNATSPTTGSGKPKPVKLIAPSSKPMQFILNLTQDEFCRRDL